MVPQKIKEGIHIKDLDQYFQERATFSLGSPIEGCESSCLEGTQTATLQSIQDWIQDDEEPAMYWLNAMSGTGKSTIARTIAKTLVSERNNAQPSNVKCSLAASFFFSKGDDSRNTAQHVLTTIARCFTFHRPDVTKLVAEACAELDNIMSRGFSGLWDVLIEKLPKFVEASKAMRKTPERWIVVIDALDECQDTSGLDIRHMLERFSQCNAHLNNDLLQIRFLVTSRTENHIERAFGRLKTNSFRKEMLQRINVVGLNRKMLWDNDIAIYLHVNLRRIAEEKFSPPDEEWPGNDAIEELAKKSQGLFIYAATCCRFLERLARQRLEILLKDTNDKIIDDPTPQGQLFKIYGQVIKASMDNDKWMEDERHDLRDILGSLIVLAEPVSIHVLNLLLPRQEDLGSLGERMGDFQSVIHVPKDKDTPVTIHHLSFHNFLVHQQTRTTYPWLWIDEMKTNTRMLDRCLKLLEEGLNHQDICDVRLPGIEVNELSQDNVQRCIPLYLQYACCHWIHHLSRSGAALSSEVAQKVYDFLKSRFLFWVEAMAWMKETSATIAMVVQLREIFAPAVTPAPGNSVDYVSLVKAFAKDARMFLFANRSIVESTPLQLYCSALLFSPSKSVIRQLYGNEHIPSWIKRNPHVPEHWFPRLFTLMRAEYLDVRLSPDTTIRISADSTVIAAAQSSSIVLWNIITGEKISSLRPNGQDVYARSIAFSGRGDAMMLACVHRKKSEVFSDQTHLNDQTSLSPGVTIWDIASGDVILTFDHIDAEQVEFSSDAKTVTSVSRNGTIKSWDVSQCQNCEVHQSIGPWQERPSTRSWLLEISPGGQQVAFHLSEPDGIGIWNIQAGFLETELPFNDLRRITWSRNGSLLAAISEKAGTIPSFLEVWSVSTWETKIRVPFQENLEHVAICPDDSVLALVGCRCDCRTVLMLVNASDGGKLWASLISDSLRGGLHFSPDSQYLVSASYYEGISVWDVATCILAGDESRMGAQDTRGRDSWGDQTCSTQVRLGDIIEDREYENRGCTTKVLDFSLSSENFVLLLYSGHSNREVRVVSIDDMETTHSLHVSDRSINRVFHFGTTTDIVAYESGGMPAGERTLNLWNLTTGAIGREVKSNSWVGIPNYAFSPNGRFFVHSDCPGKWQLREVPTGAVRFEKTSEGHTFLWGTRFNAFPVFSADGCVLAVPEVYDTNRYEVSIWLIPSGVEKTRLGPKNGELEYIELSASGSLLAISPGSPYCGSPELWDLRSGTCWSANPGKFPSCLVNFKKETLLSENCCHLDSKYGIMPLPNSVRIPAGEMPAQVDHNAHLWFSRFSQWLMHDSERLIYLPSSYLPLEVAVKGSTVALVGFNDGIAFFEFSLADMPTTFSMQGGVYMDAEHDYGIWEPGHHEDDDDEETESELSWNGQPGQVQQNSSF